MTMSKCGAAVAPESCCVSVEPEPIQCVKGEAEPKKKPSKPKPSEVDWSEADEETLMALIDQKQAYLEQTIRRKFDVLRSIAKTTI